MSRFWFDFKSGGKDHPEARLIAGNLWPKEKGRLKISSSLQWTVNTSVLYILLLWVMYV